VLHKKLIQISKSTNLQIMESWPMEPTTLMEIASNSSQHSSSLFPAYTKVKIRTKKYFQATISLLW
jgi:hypothetical protein